MTHGKGNPIRKPRKGKRIPRVKAAAKAAQRIIVGIGRKGSPGTRGIISKRKGRTIIGRSSIIRGILRDPTRRRKKAVRKPRRSRR